MLYLSKDFLVFQYSGRHHGTKRQETKHVKKARLTIYKSQSWDSIITPFLRMESPWVNNLLKILPSSYCYNGNYISAAFLERTVTIVPWLFKTSMSGGPEPCISICCSSYCHCGSFIIFSTWHHVELTGINRKWSLIYCLDQAGLWKYLSRTFQQR